MRNNVTARILSPIIGTWLPFAVLSYREARSTKSRGGADNPDDLSYISCMWMERAMMRTSDEYRELAILCGRWAKLAKSEEERRTFLEMAGAWTKLAEKAEKRLSSEQPEEIKADAHETGLRRSRSI